MDVVPDTLMRFFEEGIPFNAWLGMRMVRVDASGCRIHLPFRPELVGDPTRPALHGGVLSALADTAGGLAVFARLASVQAQISTIDLQLDYYAPGELRDLFADASVLRLGNRVAFAAIRLHHGDETTLVAAGRGAYNVRGARNPRDASNAGG